MIECIPRGYVHESRAYDSMEKYKDTVITAECNGYQGLAWQSQSHESEGSYIFMPYDIEYGGHGKQLDEFVYIEQKLESEIRRIDDNLREEARQISD